MAAKTEKGAIFVVNERNNGTSTTLGGRYPSKGNINTTQLGIKAYATIVEDGDYRQIAYDPVLSTKYGIYTDEWPIKGQELEAHVKKLKKIHFNGGVLWTRPQEHNLRDYLRAYLKQDGYSGYHEIDPAKSAQERMVADRLISKAKQLVYEGDPKDVISYAMALGVRTHEEKRLGGHQRPYETIQWDLISYAEQDPEGFINGWQDPATERQVAIRKGLQKGILSLDQTRNGIFWRHSGANIVTAPIGESPVEFWADNVGQNEQYTQAFSVLENMIEGGSPENVREAQDGIQGKNADLVMGMDIDTLVEFALEQGVIETRSPRSGKDGVGYYIDDKQVSHLSKAQLKKALTEDEELADVVRNRISIEA